MQLDSSGTTYDRLYHSEKTSNIIDHGSITVLINNR